ncbi:MAG: SRPBCC family protein, partial [Actinobacteria bacterium]|nr:SRPBCC family protein [Actinomycetota bacterium]
MRARGEAAIRPSAKINSVRISHTVPVDATPEALWRIVIDVERWSELTPSITAVELVDSGALHVGQLVRVRQPKLGAAVWRVTDLIPNREFTWVATRGGVTTTARHLVEPDGA